MTSETHSAIAEPTTNGTIEHGHHHRHRHHLILCLPLELILFLMDHLDTIYTLKALLAAFPDELLPLFKTYSKSIVNTIFWRPVRHYNDERGVVYRWIIRELKLEHLFDADTEDEGGAGKDIDAAVQLRKGERLLSAQSDCREDMWAGLRRKIRDRFILSDGNDID